MKNKRIELLAPAGNINAFYAAVDNGADAVYMGGLNFSARAFAENFDYEKIKEVINYAHLRNVKIYITVNTLLTDLQFPKVKEDIDFYYKNNVDGLIIQDLGLYYYVKNNYPDFDLHASTQMHIHNLKGVKNAKKLGFKRVVIARESSLDLIKEVCKVGIEIETFIHGALCVSFSGQCLLSSKTKNRSANKGMCAQCCRLKYEALDNNYHNIQTETDYLLSPRDMFLLNDVDKLIEAGVSSLKIEGRMKSAAYVGYVVRMYRKAIDAYYNKQKFEMTNNEIDNLKSLFNREYTNTFLYEKNEDIFKQSMPNHLGIKLGKISYVNRDYFEIKLERQLNQFDAIRIVSDKSNDGFYVNMMSVNGKLTSSANPGEIVRIDKKYYCHKNDDVYLTVNHKLEEEIESVKHKHIPLDLDITVKANNKVNIHVSNNGRVFNYQSDIVALKAENAPLNEESIKKQFSKLNDTPYYLNSINVITDNAFLRVSELNSIRNDFINAYNQNRLNSFKRKTINTDEIYKDISISNNDLIQNNDYINDYYLNPVINQKSVYTNNKKQVISEFGGLFNCDQKIAYYTLNASNSYAYEFLLKLGFNQIILSTELNGMEINSLIENYYLRNNAYIKPTVLIKGRRALMYIKNNPFEKYENIKYLKDNDNILEIKVNDGYVELIEDKYLKEDISLKELNTLIIND